MLTPPLLQLPSFASYGKLPLLSASCAGGIMGDMKAPPGVNWTKPVGSAFWFWVILCKHIS